MFDWLKILQIVLKFLFWGAIPLAVIYYRYKKTISTGFAVGIIISTFLLGLMSVATVKQDPIKVFMNRVNSKNYEESKKAYKIIIQYGPEYLEKIDESQILDLVFYEKIKKDIQDEYFTIASRYLNQFSVASNADCKELVTQQGYLHNLKHAVTLLNYSKNIGKAHDDLEKKLQVKIQDGEKVMAEMEERCD